VDAGHGFLSRIAAEFGEHLGYRVIDRALDRDRSSIRIPKWVLRARLLAEIPGVQVVGLQAVRGAPHTSVASWCAYGLGRTVTLIVPSSPGSYLVALPSELRRSSGPLQLSELGSWDPAFIEAFRWSGDGGVQPAAGQVPTRLIAFLELPGRGIRDRRSQRHEILSEEHYLRRYVLPTTHEHVGTEALLAKLATCKVNAGSKTTARALALEESRQTSIRNEIVRRNLLLATWCAYRRQNGRKSLTFADLVQEAVPGLIRAVSGYDSKHGATYTTYALLCVRQKIGRAIDDKDEFIRFPAHHNYDRKLKLRARIEVESLDRLPRSVRAGLRDEDDGLAGLNAAALQELRHRIALGLSALEHREAFVLANRFGLCGLPEKTLAELGDTLDLTRERIRQIEAKALERITFRLMRAWRDGRVV
jgi:RNA polymerase sigma factor (sigma-70 family)